MRRILIAGNAKMNLDRSALRALLEPLAEAQPRYPRLEVVMCPPFPLLPEAQRLLQNTDVGLGGQNMYWEPKGAFTGEVSASMLRETGCTHVILGHSERREYFGETDEGVARKTRAALAAGLVPIVCVGETLAQREAGDTEAVLSRQVKGGLQDAPEGDIVVAYEPVWAIGTGKTATLAQAQEAHAFLRSRLAGYWGDARAGQTRILYGGSVKGANARELLALEDVDGALVGGASLTAEAFLPILAGAPD